MTPPWYFSMSWTYDTDVAQSIAGDCVLTLAECPVQNLDDDDRLGTNEEAVESQKKIVRAECGRDQ